MKKNLHKTPQHKKKGGKPQLPNTTDVMTPAQRSRCMSNIRGSDTGPELRFRRLLWKQGLRYRLGYKKIPGKPDIVLVSARIAIFIDGCFWHSCPLHATKPKANSSFWKTKLKNNIERDRLVNSGLRENGWRVIRLWEHEIENDLQSAVRRTVAFFRRKRKRL